MLAVLCAWKLITKKNKHKFVWLNGLVVIAHLEFELGDPGSIPGSRHYSIV